MEQVYAHIRACMTAARTHFPDATKLVPVYSPGSDASDVLVEVWANGRANVVPMTPHGPAQR